MNFSRKRENQCSTFWLLAFIFVFDNMLGGGEIEVFIIWNILNTHVEYFVQKISVKKKLVNFFLLGHFFCQHCFFSAGFFFSVVFFPVQCFWVIFFLPVNLVHLVLHDQMGDKRPVCRGTNKKRQTHRWNAALYIYRCMGCLFWMYFYQGIHRLT